MKKTTAYKAKNDSDELNPNYLFSTEATDLLVAIINGQIDAVEIAKRELDRRGLDHKTGQWVGFKSK